MIAIRFSINSHSEEIDLSGSPRSLQHVRKSILNLLDSKEQSICVIKADIIDPSPYDICLTSLSIYKSNTLLKVSVFSDSLQIEGKLRNLEIFADWFDFDDDTPVGYHSHFDPYGNESWVDPNSSSLIISVASTLYPSNSAQH